MSKFKRKNVLSFLAVLILAMAITGCGAASQEDNSSTKENVTSDSTTEPTTQPTGEPADEYYGLSQDEYYVDCPIVLEDGRLVFVKKVPNLQYYPEGKENADGETCLEEYEKSNKTFTTSLSMDEDNIITKTQVVFEIAFDHSFVNAMSEWYDISTPEIWDNEVTSYQISGYGMKNYILYYPLDDKYSMYIGIWGFINDEGENFEDELEELFEFYRTEQDVFVVIGSAPEIGDDEIVSGDVIEDNTEDGTSVEEKEYDLSASYTVVYDGSKGVTGQMENLVLADNPDWADKEVTFTTDGVTGTLSMTAPTVIGNNAIVTHSGNNTEYVTLFGEPSFYMIYLNVSTGTQEEFDAYFNERQSLTVESLSTGKFAVENGIYEIEKGETYVRTYEQYVPITTVPNPSMVLTIASKETNCAYQIIITDFSLTGETLPEETRTEMMEILKSVEIVVE